MTDEQIERVARAMLKAMAEIAPGPQVPYDDVTPTGESQREILAHIARAAITAASEWLPIESAPKDGTPIDIWTGNAEFPQRDTDISWRKPTDSEFWTNGSDDPSPEEGTFSAEPGWFDCLGYKYDGDRLPTHWQPLPQPPKVKP
jgi:hypothetical protein